MSDQKYVIAWRSLRTGAQGQGTAQFSKAEADAIVESLREEPKQDDLIHWAEPVESTDDLDTQPITPIDDGVDTIVLPPLDEGR